MKVRTLTIVLIIVILAFFGIMGWWDSAHSEDNETEKLADMLQKRLSICPKTLQRDACMSCHVMIGNEWKLRETNPADIYDLPYSLRIVVRDGKQVAYTRLGAISSASDIQTSFEWLMRHPEFKYWIIELQSPGGSMMGAKRMRGYMDMYKATGGIIETQCFGYAASAGFSLLLNGSMGHRFVHPQAEIMWHEISIVKWISIESVSGSEDEAEVMRHFQDTENEWVASRSNLTKEELDKLIKRKDYWVNGKDAVMYGFADGFTSGCMVPK